MKILLTSALQNPGMATISGLRNSGVEIIGADDRQLPFRSCSRYLKRFYLYCSARRENAFLESLKAIVNRERPDVFFPIESTHLIAKHAAQFEPYTQLLLPEYTSFRIAYDNQATMETCHKLGIACPRIFSLEQAEKHLHGHPGSYLVIKPRKDIGGGVGVDYVNDIQSLLTVRRMNELRFGDCVIQEYIPGETTNMRTVNLLFDRKSRLVAYFTTRKIRQWPNEGGITALSISTNETGLVEGVRPFFEKLGWKGLAEVELKVDDRDGQAKVIEINPRVWGYFGFPIGCGVNFPWLYCQAAMGWKLPRGKIGVYRIGIKYINPFAYLKAVVADWKGAGDKHHWPLRLKRELQGRMVGNYWHWRDLRVILAKVLYEAKALLPSGATRNRIHP